jgi:hypothetical protein
MSSKRKLEGKIAEQQEKIRELEIALLQSKAYLSGLVDSLKLIPGDVVESTVPTLRDGSDLAKVRDILKVERKPLHVDDLLNKLGKELTKNNKGSLVGSLGAYVKRGAIFTRPGPNIFGLVEFEASENSVEPPGDFGAETKPPTPNAADDDVPF